LVLVKACITESATVRSTAMVVFCCESTARQLVIIKAFDSAL